MQRTNRSLAGLLVAAVMVSGLIGCRQHMPHSFTWPASGDQIPTHPKPPEGGYYKNWDPYAVELTVTPTKALNPVQTQHVLIATVLDEDGEPLKNRRVEWIISEGSVGDIVEVDESGWRASRGYKVDNHFAVSHTNNFDHVLDRGNDDPSDDIVLTKGQTWCVITSPIEGETYITAYAPGIYDWSKHKVFVTKTWQDVQWECPEPATNPIGTNHEFTTWVGKYSDGSPLQGYEVTYKIVDGPPATFQGSGRDSIVVKTDSEGMARATIVQTQATGGTNNVAIDIVRPADLQCCKPAIKIAECQTSKTWIPPEINISKSAPAQKMVNEEFQYSIRVWNPSSVPANNVVVTDTLPNGIQYVSSQPSASVSGSNLSWSMGTFEGGQSGQISITVRGTRTGEFNNCAEVRTAEGLSANDCAPTRIVSAALALEKTCPSEVMICDPIEYVLSVRNTGDGPATNVRVVDNLPDGLMTRDGRNSVTFDAGTLNAGETKQARITVEAKRTGTFVNRATATGDGGLTASAECTTVVRQPVLVVTKSGPNVRFIGRPAEYQITVSNKGDAPARDTVLVDDAPGGLEFIQASDNGSMSGGRVTWQLGTLQPGASKTVTARYKALRQGSIRNTATAKAYCAEATAASEMAVKGIPAILLECVDNPDPIEIGQPSTYQITVTNQGSAVGTNIRIVCQLPAEQEHVSSDGPTRAAVAGNTVTFDPLPTLAPKASATYRVQVKGLREGDVRFKVTLTSDQMTSPAEETESTHIY
ncbi:MAG: DUF11 domain-containing protein [Phycisphaerales bacterium]|nr:DUF11 domain-containing protein [Phycisphaerales bacterium]